MKTENPTYQTKKTETSYIVTYRGETREFPFLGSSFTAWQETEAWMRHLDVEYTKPTPKKYEWANADFKKYYDNSQKRNIWVLGYFGGGSVNISEATEVARAYAKQTKAPFDTVKIDEVLSSRRFKGFKYVYSIQEQEKEDDAEAMDNVHQWLRD